MFSLEDVVGADVFLGLSSGGVLTKKMVKKMAARPIIFAMANPVPEIGQTKPKKLTRCYHSTGRSDFPNQVNNVLGSRIFSVGLWMCGPVK